MKKAKRVGKTKAASSAVDAGTIVVPESGLKFVTPDGKLLARLCNEEHGADLALFNTDGVSALSLGSTPDGGIILTSSRRTNGQVAVFAVDGGGILSISNARGNSTVHLSSKQDGGSIEIANNDLHCKAYMSVQDDAGIVVVNNHASQVAGVMGSEDGDGHLVILDRAAVKTFAVPVWKYANSQEQKAGQQAPEA